MKVTNEMLEVYCKAEIQCTSANPTDRARAGLKAVLGYLDSIDEDRSEYRKPKHWVHEIMDKYGLNQKELAFIVGTNASCISRMATGKVKISPKMKKRIYAAIEGMEPTKLLSKRRQIGGSEKEKREAQANCRN